MEALDPLDENCIILNLRDFYAECLATVDIFYECIEKKSRITYLQQNLDECLSKASFFGTWIHIMLSMSPPSKVDNLLRDVVTSFENEELMNNLVQKVIDPIKVKSSSGRESIFKADEVYRFQVANIVARRVQLILGTEKSCGKRIFEYSLQYSTSHDLQLQAIASSFLLGKVKSDNDITTNIVVSKTIIPILISNAKQFETLCDIYHKSFHLELEAEKEMTVNTLQFNELLTLIARTCIEEDLDFPLHYYLKDHHNLKVLHDRKSASTIKHSTIQNELNQLKLELKVLFAVLRSCMMSLSYCLSNMFRLNLFDITTIGNFNNKINGDDKVPLKTTNKRILSLLVLLESLPWDILQKVSLLEQYLYLKSTSSTNFNNITSIQVTRIFATVCCLVHKPLAPTIIPWVVDAINDLANDSAWLCHNNSMETSQPPVPLPPANASSGVAIDNICPNISDNLFTDNDAMITSIRTNIPLGVTVNSILSFWIIRQYPIIWSERKQYCFPQDKLDGWLLDYHDNPLSNDDTNSAGPKEETADEAQWMKLLTPWVAPSLKTSPADPATNRPVQMTTTGPLEACFSVIDVISKAISSDSIGLGASLFLEEEGVIDHLKLIATSEVGCAAYVNARCEAAARYFLSEFMTGPTGSVGSLYPLHLIDYNLAYHPYLPVAISKASVSLCQLFHTTYNAADPLFSYIISIAVCQQRALPNQQQIELAIPAFRILTCLLSGNMPSRLFPSRGRPHLHLCCSPQLDSCAVFYNVRKYHILRCVAMVARWLLQDCELEYTCLRGPDKVTLMAAALSFVAAVAALSATDVRDVFDREAIAATSRDKEESEKWEEAFPATTSYNAANSLTWMSVLLSILKYGAVPSLQCGEPYALVSATRNASHQTSKLKKELDIEVEVVSRKTNLQEACAQLLCVLTQSDRLFCESLLSIVSDGGTESTVSDCIRSCLQSSHNDMNIIQHSFRLALYLCHSAPERDRNSYTSAVYRFKMSFTHIRSSGGTSSITGKGSTGGGTGFSAAMEVLIATLEWLISHLEVRISMVSHNTNSKAPLAKEKSTTTAAVDDDDNVDNNYNDAFTSSKYKYLLSDSEEEETSLELDLYTALDVCLLGLECVAAICDGRAELQEKMVMEFEVIFSLLPKLLATLCSYANASSAPPLDSIVDQERVVVLETGFYSSIIATVAKSLRAFVGRYSRAKELALSHGSLEGVIPSLQFAVGSGVTVHDVELGQQLARTVEALTSRNIRAWARVEKVAGAKGLLSLSFLGRPVIQIQAMTSLAAIMSSQASIGDYHYVNEVVENGGVLVARDLLSDHDTGVQYAALRLLQSLLLHSLDTQSIAFRLDVLLPLCTLLESLEPSIVRETCAVLVLFGSWDQAALRGLVDAKSMQDKNGKIMSTIRNKLMTIACGRSQSTLGVDIPSALAQDISSAARAAAFSLACATDPEESNWPDGGAPLRSTLTTAGIRHPY